MLEIKSIDDIVHMSKASFVGCSPAALTNGTRTLATSPWAQSFPAELLARIFLHLRDISVQCYGYPRPSWLALREDAYPSHAGVVYTSYEPSCAW
ncbi:hypothetical protein BD311DRAFT_772171 [Dichomitus squalens]|uniref:Uncharacterized protein n=1 Tax=Dichomitus squalens TaxID=114155 RepID=A0A4Q9M3K5_9APHY|nr:hypothetical protein BD311DRAFT_772171 [Dichomitus squalens]